MTPAIASFVLVHGALGDSSAWKKVAPLLRESGAVVATPDNPGAAADFEGGARAPEFEDYVAAIEREIDAAPKPVVLVGYSSGGIIITQVAENRPDDIAALVYLCAYLPIDGETLQGLTMSDEDSMIRARLRIDPATGKAGLSPEDMREIIFHDCSPEDAAAGMAHTRPESLALLRAPVHSTGANFGRVPRYYITTLRDRAVSPALQKRMYERTPVEKVYAIDSGHVPSFSRAGELATALLEIADAARTSHRR